MIRQSRYSERGSIKGCCCSTVLAAIVICGLIAVLTLTSIPAGVRPLTGVQDGSTPSELGAVAASIVTRQLLAHSNAEIVFTDKDLTVLAIPYLPKPSPFQTFIVTTWNGEVVVAGLRHLGFLPIWEVGYFSLNAGPTTATLSLTLVKTQVGSLAVPTLVAKALSPQVAKGFDLGAVFRNSPVLSAFNANLDCGRVTSSGVEFWVHSPLAPVDPKLCTP